MTRNIVHRIYAFVFPRWIKNALEQSIIELERFNHPRTVELPPGQRVLVLAPHPDDESIGCGGTVRKFVENGSDVCIVILTDGRLGNPILRQLDPNDPERLRKEDELADRRKCEANAALDVLGVKHRHFLNAIDGSLRSQVEPVATRLAKILSEWRPNTILLPFLTDRHVDHFAANRCFIESVRMIHADWPESLICLGYETWSPIYANVYVDISTTIEFKRRAISCHESQLEFNNFLEGVEGLNRFRAESGLTGGTYAEAFFQTLFPTYRALYHKLLL